jgi:uncharacterized protein YjbJ (UPF0337 family)
VAAYNGTSDKNDAANVGLRRAGRRPLTLQGFPKAITGSCRCIPHAQSANFDWMFNHASWRNDMDKDEVKGKAKDIAGRVERQVGEWTGDEKAQVKGAAKQVEGKVQNAWGKAKDAVKKPSTTEAEKDQADREEAERRDRRAVNE